MIRVALPHHLRTLAHVDREVAINIEGPITIGTVLDAVEDQYPMLRGTIRDHVTHQRRPFIRFFACGQDLSHQPTDMSLPAEIGTGTEPFRVIGAMAGG
jgi:molybdopterin synthase sulfur carrier subunit